MNTNTITYKRGTTIAYGPEVACIHVIFNGEHVLNILNEEGFTAYELSGEHFCGGFQVLLRDCKEIIERLLPQRAAEAQLDALQQVQKLRDEAMDQYEAACRLEQRLERAIAVEVDALGAEEEPFERIQIHHNVSRLRLQRSHIRQEIHNALTRAQDFQKIVEQLRAEKKSATAAQ